MNDMSMSDWFIRTQLFIDEANEQSRTIRSMSNICAEYLSMELDYTVSDLKSDLINISARLHRLVIAQRLYIREAKKEVSDE